MTPVTARDRRDSMRRLSRGALLVLSMLSACAANDYGFDDGAPVSKFKPTGTIAAYLSGKYAAQRSDMATAAEKLEVAARESGVHAVAEQAFLAAVLSDRPETPQLAAGLPDNPVAQLVLADQDAKDGRWADAEARFAGLPAQGLTLVLRPLLTAWAQAGEGRTAAALTTLQPFIETGRLRGVMALHAGMIADLGGQTADAARLYRLAQVEYGTANLRLAVVLASWQARLGYVTEAQRIIREVAGNTGELGMSRLALEADVSERPVRDARDGLAETYLAMAATLRQQNAIDSAQILLHLALSMRPDFSAARLLLADIEETGRHHRAALLTLAPVPTNDPLSAMVTLRRASILDTTGQSDEAVRLLDTMATQYPDRAEPLAAAGNILRRQGKLHEATAAYDRAVARVGAPSRANWPLFFERGIAYERAGDWPHAESDFQTALQLAPDQAAVLNYLGYAWAERGEHLTEARQMIEHAVQLQPNDGAYIDSLGWVQLRGGDAPGALKNLQRAVELQPEDAVINGHLGDAMAAVGRWREAEFQWRRALLLKPDPEDEARINRMLSTVPGAARVAAPAAGQAPTAAQQPVVR
jgi:tetratricopeptide (TPR) repeat protein